MDDGAAGNAVHSVVVEPAPLRLALAGAVVRLAVLVGAGVGRISLYKGRECVERNIPQEEALDRLIELIKANGDWRDA